MLIPSFSLISHFTDRCNFSPNVRVLIVHHKIQHCHRLKMRNQWRTPLAQHSAHHTGDKREH